MLIFECFGVPAGLKVLELNIANIRAKPYIRDYQVKLKRKYQIIAALPLLLAVVDSTVPTAFRQRPFSSPAC
jgi:hypothetical protein